MRKMNSTLQHQTLNYMKIVMNAIMSQIIIKNQMMIIITGGCLTTRMFTICVTV